MNPICKVSVLLQAMGRIGEVICRTWQTADKMKKFRGKLAEEKVHNLYVAKLLPSDLRI